MLNLMHFFYEESFPWKILWLKNANTVTDKIRSQNNRSVRDGRIFFHSFFLTMSMFQHQYAQYDQNLKFNLEHRKKTLNDVLVLKFRFALKFKL